MDAALLDAMLLAEVGAAEPEHRATIEQSRSVRPVQVLRPLDAPAWDALRAPGFDGAFAALLAAVRDGAVAARVEQMQSSRRLPRLESAARLDAESTVSAVRTLHWAAKVLGVDCPDLYAGAQDAGQAAHVPGARPSISLAPGVLSGTSSKQLAFIAGRALTWYRPEYHCMLYYPALEDLRELLGAALEIGGVEVAESSSPSTAEMRGALARRLGADQLAAISDAARSLGARGGEVRLEHWIRSAELTAARVGLFLCGDLEVAIAGVRSQPAAHGRPPAERVTSDVVAFCASRAHAALRGQFLNLAPQSIPPPAPNA